MCFLHAASPVLTRTASGFADLVDEHLSQARKIRPRKLEVDPVVCGDPISEGFDNSGDGVVSTRWFVQRLFHGSFLYESYWFVSTICHSRRGDSDRLGIPPVVL